jgi:putative ABC transport system permease protein
MTQNFYHVLFSLALVAVALGISWYEKIRMEKDIAIGTLRAFIQLVAVGYALEFIFNLNKLWLILLTILVMVMVGAHTAKGRTKTIIPAMRISAFSIGVGTFFTLGTMLALGIISIDPKYVIPLGGMIIGNSMNASALALERIDSEVKNKRAEIEQALALGATACQAMSRSYKVTVKASMIPTLNLMKVVGLVQLPGAMTGMILAGASPLSAVLIQIIVVYMLISAVTITAVITTRLAQRGYFTKAHQLVEGIV